MRASHLNLLPSLAVLLLIHAGAATAQTAPEHVNATAPEPVAQPAPRLDLSIVAIGSWRPNDNLRIRVWARDFDPQAVQQVALIIDGARISVRPLDGRAPDGARYADFSVPWRGLERTTLSAEIVTEIPAQLLTVADWGANTAAQN